MHRPIQIKNLCLSFPHKICFDDFSAQIGYGNRIAIIGRNGGGKSSLLKILKGALSITSGEVKIPEEAIFGYVPQIIEDFDNQSGGQRLNKAVTQALTLNPNVLLLDEPTNHLDAHNRKSLIRMLCHYQGTLIIASHDVDLLRNCMDTFWHIDGGKIQVFCGSYEDYIYEIRQKRASIEQELARVSRLKKGLHQTLMKEQERAKKSNLRGEKSIRERKWPTIVSDEKARQAVETSGKNKKAILNEKEQLMAKLAELRLPEIIVPRFSISSHESGNHPLVFIHEGSVGYSAHRPVLKGISLTLFPQDRIVMTGRNGSGKSTLVRAILNDSKVFKDGSWQIPKYGDIGYLDQHYNTLNKDKSVFDSISDIVPGWSYISVRQYLADFLFRKEEEVNALVSILSGGEKARLCLAQIAAKTPKLLILDEITNNLDLETRMHIIEVLKTYPGALIVISHDEDFLKEILVTDIYKINETKITRS